MDKKTIYYVYYVYSYFLQFSIFLGPQGPLAVALSVCNTHVIGPKIITTLGIQHMQASP